MIWDAVLATETETSVPTPVLTRIELSTNEVVAIPTFIPPGTINGAYPNPFSSTAILTIFPLLIIGKNTPSVKGTIVSSISIFGGSDGS